MVLSCMLVFVYYTGYYGNNSVWCYHVCWFSCIIQGTMVAIQCGIIMYAGFHVLYRVLW